MFPSSPLSRRQLLAQGANGFGLVASASLFASYGQSVAGANPRSRFSPGPRPEAKLKYIIFLFMEGGPSQIDTFDPKPRLDREHGQPMKMQTPKTQFERNSTILKSPWKFRPHGQSGIPVSELFPHVASRVDDLCVVRSMVAKFPEHAAANYYFHSGQGRQGHPSLGSWVTYGLGSEADNLPGFVVLSGGRLPPGGRPCFMSGYLPPEFEATIFQQSDFPEPPATRAAPDDPTQRVLKLSERLGRGFRDRTGGHDAIEAAIRNQELACRMQVAVPALADIRGESQIIRELYGLDDEFEPTRTFAFECLMARRLVQAGVRFVEVLCPRNRFDIWDQHEDLVGRHAHNARAVDKPIAALLYELRQLGLLNETLVVWAGEFGRAPMAQYDRGKFGRDHNQFGFSIWLAGGGVKPGMIHGATDEYGYFAVENPLSVHDLHATMLHLLGLDHTQLTFRFGGRDLRLTDIYGQVVHDILV